MMPQPNSFVWGVQHDTCPLELREALAKIEADDVSAHLKNLGVAESMVLSTCNRFEVYGHGQEAEDHSRFLTFRLADMAGINAQDLLHHMFHKTGVKMVRHGFGVAASVNSMVVGEPQILGQMKQAYKHSMANGYTGPFLDRFASTAFKVGKRVRTETAIAREAVSVASVAVRLAENIHGSMKNTTVLLVGAGEMCENAAQHLKAAGVADILVCNRSAARATSLASRFDANVVLFENLTEALSRADIVLTSTASKSYVVTAEMAHKALSIRRQQPLLFVDMALPRDIDPMVHELENCYVYDIDNLAKLATKGQKSRQKAVAEAEDIINQEVSTFMQWLHARQKANTIKALRCHFYDVREEILAKNLTAEEATRQLINKLLHAPLSAMRQGQLDAESARTLENLFLNQVSDTEK